MLQISMQIFETEETRSTLLDVLRGIQTGTQEDPFDWILEV